MMIGLITARGGSKGIPKKNIFPVLGRPLLSYTAEAAIKSLQLDRVILSTDDPEIAEVGRDYGLEVPFIRPDYLSSDMAGSFEVVEHALNWLRVQEVNIDGIVLLQPTSPLRNSLHIDEAINIFRNTQADALVSVVQLPHSFHPFSLMEERQGQLYLLKDDAERYLQRQKLPKFFARNGPAILILKPEQIDAGDFYSGRTIPYVMSVYSSLDIDEYADIVLAEKLIGNNF